MIIIQFDKGYKRWGELFLRSLAKHDPKHKVLMSTVGFDENDIREFEGLYENLIIENESITANKYALPIKKGDISAVMPCRKAYVLQDVMERYDEDLYVLMDADLLIRKPLDKLSGLMKGKDAGLIFRENYVEHKKINSSIVVLKLKAKKFADTWVRALGKKVKIGKIKPWAWYWDQITIRRAYEKHKGLSYAEIPKNDYIDVELKPNALIWSAHIGQKAKVKDEVYNIFNQELEGGQLEFTIEKAIDYFQNGLVSLAYVFGKRVVEKEPDNLDAWFFCGNLLVLAKDPKGAIDAYNNLVKWNYQNKDLRNNLGLSYILLKEYDKAEEQFKLGLADFPKYEKLQSNLEYARFLRGEEKNS